jgi:hypothetical protein
VVPISEFDPSNIQHFKILKDVDHMDKKMAKIKLKKSHQSVVIWEPKDFNKQNKPLFTLDYAIGDD